MHAKKEKKKNSPDDVRAHLHVDCIVMIIYISKDVSPDTYNIIELNRNEAKQTTPSKAELPL